MARIIVGYDGRDVSDDALILGRKLASAYGDELVVAAAYGFEQHPEPDAGGDHFERRARYFKQTFARAGERLGSVPFTAEAIDDLPGRGLYLLAEREDARIIVVGSTTRSRIGRALLGWYSARGHTGRCAGPCWAALRAGCSATPIARSSCCPAVSARRPPPAPRRANRRERPGERATRSGGRMR